MSRPVHPARVEALAGAIFSQPTAPFHEGAVKDAVRVWAAGRPGIRLAEDPDGNIHLSRAGARPSSAPIVFTAHMDHPGFVVTRATGRRIIAEFRGGVEDRYFPGAPVRFFAPGGDVLARVISTRRNKVSGERKVVLRASGAVPAGTFGMWDLPAYRYDRRKDLLASRVCDDLAGVAAILALFEALPSGGVDVRGLLTRGEEVGFWGAIGAARNGRIPRKARVISLEASKAFPHAPQGAGPILRVGDRASVFDDGITRALAGTAARLTKESRGAFKWQRKLMDGGTCEGTAFQAYGYKTGALCVPLANYHNMGPNGRIAAEAVRLSDLTNLVRWMAAWVTETSAPTPLLKTRLEGYYRSWKKAA